MVYKAIQYLQHVFTDTLQHLFGIGVHKTSQ